MWKDKGILNLSQQRREKKYLVSEWKSSYYNFFIENLFATFMKKTQILIKKLVYLGLSMVDIIKIVMYDFMCDYLKQKCGKSVKLCYMVTDSFIAHVKIDYIYKDIAADVARRFNTWNFVIDRPLAKGINKRWMKGELRWQNIKEFVGLKAQSYSYLMDNISENKKAKYTEKCVIKWQLENQDHKNCLNPAKLDGRLKYLEKKKFNIDKLKNL